MGTRKRRKWLLIPVLALAELVAQGYRFVTVSEGLEISGR